MVEADERAAEVEESFLDVGPPLHHLPTTAASAALRTPVGSGTATDATAFFHRKPRYYIEWDISWENDSEEKEIVAWTEGLRLALGPYVEGSYINVPNSSIEDLRTYYGDNLARLQEVKRKYDPENIFHFEQSIPPGG